MAEKNLLYEVIKALARIDLTPERVDNMQMGYVTKVGYEIPLNRHFYRYEPPRPLEEIEADIKVLEGKIMALLKEVTA